MSKIWCQKYLQNIANVWFQKSRVSSRHVQVSVLSRVFVQSLGLATSMSRLGLEDFGRDSSSAHLLLTLSENNASQIYSCLFKSCVSFYVMITVRQVKMAIRRRPREPCRLVSNALY